MQASETANKAVAQNVAGLVAYQDGSIVSRVLLKKKTGNVTVFAFGKGEGLSEHTTPHDALAYVLDGEAEIDVASEPNRVKAGEVILLPSNVPHAVRAVTDFKMMLIMLKEL